MAKQKWAEVSKKERRTGVIGLIILVFILIAVFSSGNDANKTTSYIEAGKGEPTSSASTQTSNNTKKEAVLPKIGEAARDGKFEFTAKSIECGKSSVGTNPYLTKTAQGQYCLLTVSVKNIGNEPQTLSSSNQYLYNSAKQKYSADDTATMYISPSDNASSSLYNEINPGNTVEGIIAFDLPKDQSPVQAEFHDSAFSGGVKVSLQ